MAGRGPQPKANRRRGNEPARGEWQSAPAIGWQHGSIPKPPDGLLAVSRRTWNTWFKAWYAAHWTPADVPGIEIIILLYDAVRRGELTRAAELRMGEDTWGISPKGWQDRRWVAPPVPVRDDERPSAANPYGHLKVAQ